MNKILKTIFALVVLGLTAFFFQNELQIFWNQSFNYYFPCKAPINYSLGTFDTKFGISKTDFLSAVSVAEAIWEKPIGRNLFQYILDGLPAQAESLKINLVYDVRQESTQELKNMGITVDNNKVSYDELKSKYDSLNADYAQKKIEFESRLTSFQIRQKAYESGVSTINRHGGTDRETVSRLNAERDYLNREANALNQLKYDLNNEVNNINTLVVNLNQLATLLNLNVKQFNTVGNSLGGEFDEGVYKSGPGGQEIDIYQFDNRAKLIRVLAHELGHALGLAHNDDPKAVMYRLNNGMNEKLTPADITELKKRCEIK